MTKPGGGAEPRTLWPPPQGSRRDQPPSPASGVAPASGVVPASVEPPSAGGAWHDEPVMPSAAAAAGRGKHTWPGVTHSAVVAHACESIPKTPGQGAAWHTVLNVMPERTPQQMSVAEVAVQSAMLVQAMLASGSVVPLLLPLPLPLLLPPSSVVTIVPESIGAVAAGVLLLELQAAAKATALTPDTAHKVIEFFIVETSLLSLCDPQAARVCGQVAVS